MLEKWRFATFKGTNKGTIANLINSDVFDINEECKRRTERRPTDEQETTIKNIKKEKNTHIGRIACPYESIVELFNKMLPELPHVDLITEERIKTIKARWRTSAKTQSLEWWQEFFSHVERSDFLMGRAKESFRGNFDWIKKKSN